MKIYITTSTLRVADNQPILPTVLLNARGTIAFNAKARRTFEVKAELHIPIATPLELTPGTQPCSGNSFQASELIKKALEQSDNAYI